jgi:hypothetical protein
MSSLDNEIARKIKLTEHVEMSQADQLEHDVNFAYGNLVLEQPSLTIEKMRETFLSFGRRKVLLPEINQENDKIQPAQLDLDFGK